MSTYDGSQSQHWLGAPTIGLDRNEFEQAILKRFAGSAASPCRWAGVSSGPT